MIQFLENYFQYNILYQEKTEQKFSKERMFWHYLDNYFQLYTVFGKYFPL